jgi:uncharacterized membrane protein
MNENQKNQIGKALVFVGWILFILCAIFFIASSLKNHDMLTFVGSIIFFVACIIFLISILKSTEQNKNIHPLT